MKKAKRGNSYAHQDQAEYLGEKNEEDEALYSWREAKAKGERNPLLPTSQKAIMTCSSHRAIKSTLLPFMPLFFVLLSFLFFLFLFLF